MQQRRGAVHAIEPRRKLARGAPRGDTPPAMWCVYLLRCADDSLYTGITNDLAARLLAHAAGRGARYTRGRGPFVVVHAEAAPSRSAALRREHQLKRMRRRQKLAFVHRETE